MIKNVSKITAGALSLAFLATCLASCNDKLGDYMSDANALQIEVVEGTDSISTRATYSGYHTYFTTGDAIGVYAFDGTKYVSSNVKFTKQDDGSWKPESNVVYDPTYTYYAYYPYIASPYTPTADSGDEDTKFANFISDAENKFYKLDQSSEANFTASNLMIATGTFQTGYRVKFTMLHKRGLAIISNDSDNQWYYSSDDGTKYWCTPVFTTNIPYTNSNGYYHYLVKPSTPTTVAGQTFNIRAGRYYLGDAITLEDVAKYEYSLYNYDDNDWDPYTDEKPDWLTVTSSPDDEGYLRFSVTPKTTKTTDVVIGGHPTERNVSADAKLKDATSVARSRIDLSMRNNDGTTRDTRTTANCYLVHAPGTYRIPLVYGNAIKNGQTNESAYKTTATGGFIMSNLVNHKNEAITDPWIENNGITVDGAKLIWEDVKNLISIPENPISTGTGAEKTLMFSISKDNIAEGNAVIAATSNGTVVWSWHIWVTTQTLSPTYSISIGNQTSVDVPEVNLGQITGTIKVGKTYAGSLCRIRATNSRGASVEFQITQPNYDDLSSTITYTNPCPYYQWGRKDPEVSCAGGYDTNGNNFNVYVYDDDIYDVGYTIMNPETHYYYDYFARSRGNMANQYNYWDMNQTGTGNISKVTTKTVYDPCPPGFCVPPSGLYYQIESLSETGGDVGYFAENDGYTFHLSSDHVYFSAVGYRWNTNRSLVNMGSESDSWSASLSNGTSTSWPEALGISFGSNKRQVSTFSTFCALPVHPVAEK